MLWTRYTGLHLINSSRLIQDVTILKKLYANNTIDTETSENLREKKASIIINEIDDNVIVGRIK